MYAAEHQVGLLYVPSRQIGEWHPLDFRIFGSLKQRAKARFDAAVTAKLIQNENFEFDINDALVMLLEVWKLITQDEVLNSWSHLG